MKKWHSLLIIAFLLALLAFVTWQWGQDFLIWLGAKGDLVQSLVPLVTLVSAFFSLVSGIFAFRNLRGQKPAPSFATPTRTINTDGGAVIAGNVNTGGGDSIGRDKILNIQNGNAISDSNITGNTIINAEQVVIGQSAQQITRGLYSKMSASQLKSVTEAYLGYIFDRHQYLTMKGMGPSENVPLKLKLLELYVPLKARQELPKGETWERGLKLAGRELREGDPEAAQALRLGEPLPVLELLKEKDGVVILGDPGAGKTTFLKFLALKLAHAEGAELGLDGRIPILMSFAAYANALAEKNVRLDDFIASDFKERVNDLPIDTLLRDALESGRALILLDGLDEVKDLSLRTTVVERVTDFYTAHHRKGNKFVLTSRVVGYRAVRSVAEGMTECTLTDFDDDEIAEFILKWTTAIEKHAIGDTAVARHDAELERRELLESMQTNDGVRGLAANPLLLTILALMKRKGVTLPERRVQLYDQYVATLLSTWNRARSLSGRAPGRDLDEVQTTRVLAPLALWMHEVSPGIGLVKQQDLRRKLQEIYVSRGESNPEAAAKQFLLDVREHAAILLERGLEEYGFIHLTFEEYLAALAIALQAQGESELVVKILAAHIGEQAWREVSLLTVAYIGIRQNLPKVAGQVVEALARSEKGEAGEAALLAGEAALDALPDGVTHQSRDKVIEALIPAMQNEKAKPEIRRSAGLVLSRLCWVPQDLDDFVQIPAGRFLYGDEKEEKSIPYQYWVAKYPVTNLQFARFMKAGGYDHQKWWRKDGWDWRTGKYDSKAKSGFEKDLVSQRSVDERAQPYYWDNVSFRKTLQPVVGVTWFEAQAYCNWRSQQLLGFEIPAGYLVRLPTELEWERSARFTDGREYPWNEDFDPKFANTNESGARGVSAVCTYPLGKSQEGVWDLSGNVWEWSASWYEKGAYRSLRGGSRDDLSRFARCALRSGGFPDAFYDDLGFRCVVSLAISEF